jgi:hypothetical protein
MLTTPYSTTTYFRGLLLFAIACGPSNVETDHGELPTRSANNAISAAAAGSQRSDQERARDVYRHSVC